MKAVLVTLLVVVAFATMSAAEINFSSGFKVYNNRVMVDDYIFGNIAKDPARNIVWINSMNLDLDSGGMSATAASSSQTSVDFDKNNDAWVVTLQGTIIHKYVSGAIKTYTSADGLPANGHARTIKVVRANNQVIVGCDNGVSIITLDANENPVSFDNALSNNLIHTVAAYGKFYLALNTYRAFVYDGSSWTTYDTTNSTLNGQCFDGTVDQDGNFYVSTATADMITLKVSDRLAKFNCSTKVWSSIDISAIADSAVNASQIRIDRNNQLWCVFPQKAVQNTWFCGYLVKMDLATGAIEKSPIDGTSQYPWLNQSTCGGNAALGLTVDGNIIIGANGAVVIGNSANAVIPRLAPKVERGNNFQFVGQFDLRGRVLSKTFSVNNSASGMSIMLYRTAEGKVVRAEKTLIAR
jgi:hypothetical protein